MGCVYHIGDFSTTKICELDLVYCVIVEKSTDLSFIKCGRSLRRRKHSYSNILWLSARAIRCT